MEFMCNFDYLVQNLTDVSEVVEDALLSEDLRNVIFEITKDSITLVGVNQLVVFRRPLDHQYYAITSTEQSDFINDGICYIQLKSKELTGYLNSYKGVRRTSIEEVTFKKVENKVKCTVAEKDLDNGRMYSSSWVFNNIEVKKSMFSQLNMQKPSEELTVMDSNNLLFYTKNMLPLLQAGTSLYSKLVFSEDYVIAFTATHVTFMNNILGGSFAGFTLLYRAVTFMDKVICNSGQVSVGRMERHLYFETDTSQAFIMYDNRLPDYKLYLNMYNRDHAFTLDRVYLKDILKRLKLLNESVELAIDSDNNELALKNTKFAQSIPLMQVKALDEYGVFKFKIMPDILNKAVIGSDDEFSGEIFVYYCPQPNKTALLVLTDDSNSWFSAISIKPY